jgi:hypothetical protein
MLSTTQYPTVFQVAGEEKLEGTTVYPSFFPSETVSNDSDRPVKHGEKGEDRVVFALYKMIAGFPYPFRFLDHYMVAIKNADGELNVYYFPQ